MAVPSFVTSVGAAGASNVCTPGADLWVSPGQAMLLNWYYAGVCPAGGTITCANSTLPTGRSITYALRQIWGGTPEMDAVCFQDTRVMGGTSSGTPSSAASSVVSGSVTLEPFQFTSAQQVEVYQSLGLVFGAFLGALTLVWGYRQLLRLLAVGAPGSD